MKRFRSIILPMQGHSKSQLHWLYNTASNIEEKEKIFSYEGFKFWFAGRGASYPRKIVVICGDSSCIGRGEGNK